MAVLELARTVGAHGFEKYVAVKRIDPKWADDPEFIKMFLDEARLAAVLDHPNVVRVHDLGHDDVGPFFVMDYIHGEDLLAIVRRTGAPIRLEHALTIGVAAATGLHHAHTRRDFEGKPLKLIHRDVSLSNILVTYDGGVKLVDFGIAKAMGADGTRPSIRKGKVGYMSPEQCKGAPLDARSDVFALGIVLWELLTGQRLFHDDNEFTSMNRIVNHDAPLVRETNPDVPGAVADVVHKALMRRPDERFSDARDMARALEDAAAEAKLRPSADELAAFMADLFGARAYPWESPAAEDTPIAEADSTDATRVVAASSAAPTEPRSRMPWVAVAAGLVAVAVIGGWAASQTSANTAATQPQGQPTVPEAAKKPAPEPRSEPVEEQEVLAESEPLPAAREPAIAAEPESESEPRPKPEPKRPRSKSSRRPPKAKKPAPEPTSEPNPSAFDPDGLGPVRSVLK